ncbi:MAG: sigma-70 family RNA polymerase sigma factor [Anaerolineae bacterium]|nr:sigma-70 family RNA polymerase sigma factor [Anaerolineae bacterium]
MSDWDLIQACQQGDEQAWNHVVTRYRRLVFSIALNYGLGADDAAEIMQITFIMLLDGLVNLHKDSHLGGWLATVARRNTWHLLNRRRRENLEDEPLSEIVLVDESSEYQQEQWELINWLDDGLTQLDRTCRELLLALYFDPQQPAYSEVADRMGLAVGSIGPMRARCLLRLRQIMGER